MGKHVIDVTAQSRAPREAVWELLADIDTWSEWGDWQTSGLEHAGSPVPEGVGAIRNMVRRPGSFVADTAQRLARAAESRD